MRGLVPPGFLTGPRHPAAVAVEDRLVRALAVLRVVVLVNAVGLNLWRAEGFEHPRAGALVVLAMVVWTVVAIRLYAEARRRTPLLLVVDLSIAVAAMLVSPVVKGEDMRATVPGFWIMGALIAWAVHGRLRGGLVASLVLAATDLAIRTTLTQGTYGNVFLVLIGGPIIGFMAGSLQQMAVERDEAERAAAASAERARLARAVHDGVLQVLALVQRRGGELGPDGAALARLAGEQEDALRRLIRDQDAVPVGDAAALGEVDLAAAVTALEEVPGVRVELVLPGAPVPLEPRAGEELVAAARECLHNVARHVGDGARAWVVLEDLGERVVLAVRDEGPGIPAGRLEQAEAEGRLGVAGSVRRRLAELGGDAVLTTSADGTEWELVVPRPVPRG